MYVFFDRLLYVLCIVKACTWLGFFQENIHIALVRPNHFLDNNHIDMVDIGVVSGNSAMLAFFCLS